MVSLKSTCEIKTSQQSLSNHTQPVDDQIQYLPAGPGHVFAATFVDRGCALPTECTAHQKLFAVYYFGIDRSTD